MVGTFFRIFCSILLHDNNSNPTQKLKQMHRQRQNSLNNSQMDLVMQRMMETHTQLTQVVTQNMISGKSNELPPGVQQLLDAHTHIVQMASQIMTNSNNISPSDPRNDKPEEHVVTRNQACKLCGDIGHMSKDCEEQCHSCGRDHCNEECACQRLRVFCAKEQITSSQNVTSTLWWMK
jgi:hypothetical protein